MRDVLAVAAVIVVALGLGGVAAYMSVDFTPPGLDLIRPPAPAVVKRIERQEKQRAVQVEASGCKYCATVAELAQTFSRRAETARTHAAALKAALPQVSDEAELAASRREELRSAEVAAVRAEEAAGVLTSWASRCTSESFCKAPRVEAASCASEGDPRAAAAQLIASSVRKSALACASASCPSVDCQASGALKSDITQIEQSLDDAGGRVDASNDSTAADDLPVGASTFKAELTRINDEAGYVAKMLPLLLDKSKANGQLPKLAPEMIDERAVSAAQLASVMEQSAAVGGDKVDPRYEAGWRLKSLAANLAAMGKDTQAAATGKANWEKVADTLGAALLDLARLQAMVDQVEHREPAQAGCDATVTTAVQQLREARAMLDLCRMRSACIGRGGAGSTVKTTAGANDNIFERAQNAAAAMDVQDLGGDEVVQVGDQEPSAIEILRSKGVCRRAGELREAKAAAPVVTQAVAEAAVPPAFTPGTGVVSPQDLIAGAAQAALETPPANDVAETAGVVEASARYSDSAPRFKPGRMHASDPALMQTAAPRQTAPTFQPGGTMLPEAGAPSAAFGGEGGPTRATPPPPSKDE